MKKIIYFSCIVWLSFAYKYTYIHIFCLNKFYLLLITKHFHNSTAPERFFLYKLKMRKITFMCTVSICRKLSIPPTIFKNNRYLNILLSIYDHIFDNITVRIKLNYGWVTIFNKSFRITAQFAANFWHFCFVFPN